MPLFEAENLSVRFGGVRALDGVSLHVHAGEIVALIGPNGAGKSTLFNAVSGTGPLDSGRVVFDGNDITALPPHGRARLGLGRTFQNVQVFSGLTVAENLATGALPSMPGGLVADILGLPGSSFVREASSERARAFLHFLDLEDVADVVAGDLPFGLARLVELGRALCTEPQLLLLDEPASGLDAGETDRLVATLRRVRDLLGVTILFVEHDVGMVMRISDYVHVLDFGRLIARGTPEAVRHDDAVIAAYLGEERHAAARG